MYLSEYLDSEQFKEVIALFQDPSKHYIADRYLKSFLIGNFRFLETGDTVYVSIYNNTYIKVDSEEIEYLIFNVVYNANLESFKLISAAYTDIGTCWEEFPEFITYYNATVEL